MSINNTVTTSLNTDINSYASYFILNGLEIAFTINLNGTLATNDTSAINYKRLKWGAGAGVRYYFDIGNYLFPYVGLAADFDITQNWTGTLVYRGIAVTGLLIGLNDVFAIDLSMPIKVEFAGRTYQQTAIAPGCIGVRYFF